MRFRFICMVKFLILELTLCPVVVLFYNSYVLSTPLASKVWKMLKDQNEQACRGSRHLKIFGKSVCNKGLMKIVGLGKSRFAKMRRSISHGELCPFDMRFTPRVPKLPSKARESVQDFLTRLYNEAAEALPDGWNSNKRPRQGVDRLDPKSMNRTKIKHLPHASIGDYYKQCVAQFPDMTISRKLFSSAPLLKTLDIIFLWKPSIVYFIEIQPQSFELYLEPRSGSLNSRTSSGFVKRTTILSAVNA